MNTKENALWTKNFIIFSISSLFMNVGVQFLLPILPLYATNILGASEAQVGYLLGLYSFAALLARPLAGYSFDSFNRKWTFMIALIVFALLFLFYSMISTFLVLLILRIIHGIAFSFTTTGAATNITDILPNTRRTEGIGYFGLTNTLSMAIGPAIALWIIAKGDFFTLFLSGTLVVGGAYFLTNLIKFPKVSLSKKKLSLNNMFEKRVFSVAFTMLLSGVVTGGILSFIILYSENELHQDGGKFFILYAVGVVILRILTTRMLKMHGPIPIVIIGFIIQSIGMLMLAMANGFILFIMSSFLLGMANGAIMPTLQAMVMNMVKADNRGVANSTFFAAIDIGIGGGSILLGWIVGITSLRIMFLITAVFNIIPLVLFIMYVIKDYQKKMIEV